MNKKSIQNYIDKHGMNGKQKLEKSRGGQFLENFLLEFSEYVRQLTYDEVIGTIRDFRNKNV